MWGVEGGEERKKHQTEEQEERDTLWESDFGENGMGWGLPP